MKDDFIFIFQVLFLFLKCKRIQPELLVQSNDCWQLYSDSNKGRLTSIGKKRAASLEVK